MTTYCVIRATITKPEAFAAYKEHAAEALAKHGGALVTTSGNLVNLDGEADGYNRITLVSFPSDEAAKAWRADESLSALHDLRNSSGNWVIQMLATA